MTIINIFDFETTGIPIRVRDGQKVPSDDPAQPHVVQAAAKTINLETKEVISQMSRIVKPDGFEISQFIAELTGVSQERAMDEGVSRKDMVDEFLAVCDPADIMVAHNDPFDRKMMRISLVREYGREVAEDWYCKEGRGFFCTMKAATPICKIPPTGKMVKAGFNKFKPPKLEEAYEFFFGKKPEVCHDAMADVLSTEAILFEMIARGVEIIPTYFHKETPLEAIAESA